MKEKTRKLFVGASAFKTLKHSTPNYQMHIYISTL